MPIALQSSWDLIQCLVSHSWGMLGPAPGTVQPGDLFHLPLVFLFNYLFWPLWI